MEVRSDSDLETGDQCCYEDLCDEELPLILSDFDSPPQPENKQQQSQKRQYKNESDDELGSDPLPFRNTPSCSSWNVSDSEELKDRLEIPTKVPRLENLETNTEYRDGPDTSMPLEIRSEHSRRMTPREYTQAIIDSVNLDDISDISSCHSSFYADFRLTEGFANPPHRLNGIEFEVGSISPTRENPNPIEDLTTSDEEFLNVNLSKRGDDVLSTSPSSSSEKEQDNFADSSDSESDKISNRSGLLSSDSELSENDKWLCTQCSAKTNNPYFRYCSRCFNIRRNWLPKRPTGRNKARQPPKIHRPRLRALYTYPPGEDSIPRSTPEDDRPFSGTSSTKERSNISSSPTSTEDSTTLGTSESVAEKKPTPGPSRALSLKLQSTLDAPPVSVAVAAGTSDDPLCIICMAREKNSAFVHGKSAHFCCCFTCGDMILKRYGKCPICRKKILRVVKIII